MYVTLEPCCHRGLTPPCTDSIIKSKISEVVYSVADIDKRVRNKSFKILNSKKIIVKKPLKLDCGKTINDYPIAYETYGELNEKKDKSKKKNNNLKRKKINY